MRDAVHIGALIAVFVFLATRFPQDMPVQAPSAAEAGAFASFVTLSPDAHATLLEAARTSWQVRSESRGRPSIGRLDSGIPLLSDSLPPPERCDFPEAGRKAASLRAPDAGTYSLLPQTMGADIPAFAVKATPAEASSSGGNGGVRQAFSRDDMVSTENSTKLKEIMQ